MRRDARININAVAVYVWSIDDAEQFSWHSEIKIESKLSDAAGISGDRRCAGKTGVNVVVFVFGAGNAED